MTATNHAATGAVLALAIQTPLLVLPIALASHYFLDALLHYGVPYDKRPNHQSFGRVLVIDSVMLPITAIMLVIVAGSEWWLVLAAMIVAWSPDFVWIYRYWREKKGVELAQNRLTHWHSRLQWGERSWGWTVELAWFVLIIGVVLGHTITQG